MASIVIALFLAAMLVLVAVRAESRFAPVPMIPMQWGFSGAVNWWAPRRIGLALIPAIAVLALFGLLMADRHLEPKPGQAGTVLPAFVAIGVTMLAIQQLHLWLADRTLRR